MIIVAKPSKPFEYTGKETPRRLPTLLAYEEEINNLYLIVNESTQPNIPPPVEWDFLGIADFVRETVYKVLGREVGDKDDLFQHGCDRLAHLFGIMATKQMIFFSKLASHLDTKCTASRSSRQCTYRNKGNHRKLCLQLPNC